MRMQKKAYITGEEPSFLLLHTFARAPCPLLSIFCLFASFYGYESINIIEENRGVNTFELI